MSATSTLQSGHLRQAEDLLRNTKKVAEIGPRPSYGRKYWLVMAGLALLPATLTIGMNVVRGQSPVVNEVIQGATSFVDNVDSWARDDRASVVELPAGSVSFPQAIYVQDNLLEVADASEWVENRDDQLVLMQQLEHDPFTQALLDPMWNFKFDQVVDFFKSHNLSPEEALLIVQKMQEAQTVSIIAVNDPDLILSERQKQQEAKAWLTNAWEHLDTPNAEWKKTPSKEDTLVQLLHGEVDMEWVHVKHAIGATYAPSFPAVTQHRNDPDHVAYKNLKEARAELASAVHDTGLAGLRIPLTLTLRAEHLSRVAQSIRQVDRDLQQATGLQGPVLGINRRVVWEMGNSYETAHATVMSELGQKHIFVRSSWDKISHEWFHAFDYAQNRAVKPLGFALPQADKTLSMENSVNWPEWTNMGDPYKLAKHQHVLWENIHNPSLSDADRQAIADIAKRDAEAEQKKDKKKGDETETPPTTQSQDMKKLVALITTQAVEPVQEGSPWLTLKKEFASHLKNGRGWGNALKHSADAEYTRRPLELLATGFAGFAKAEVDNNPDALLKENETTQSYRRVYDDVTMIEARATAPIWKSYFNNTSSWWNADQVARGMAVEDAGRPVNTERLKMHRATKVQEQSSEQTSDVSVRFSRKTS